MNEQTKKGLLAKREEAYQKILQTCGDFGFWQGYLKRLDEELQEAEAAGEEGKTDESQDA